MVAPLSQRRHDVGDNAVDPPASCEGCAISEVRPQGHKSPDRWRFCILSCLRALSFLFSDVLRELLRFAMASNLNEEKAGGQGPTRGQVSPAPEEKTVSRPGSGGRTAETVEIGREGAAAVSDAAEKGITARETEREEEPESPSLPFSKARCIALVATVTGASFLNVSSDFLASKQFHILSGDFRYSPPSTF